MFRIFWKFVSGSDVKPEAYDSDTILSEFKDVICRHKVDAFIDLPADFIALKLLDTIYELELKYG